MEKIQTAPEKFEKCGWSESLENDSKNLNQLCQALQVKVGFNYRGNNKTPFLEKTMLETRT